MLIYKNKVLSKIPVEIMDPLDILIIKFYSHFFDLFYQYKVTPNMLTIVGGILQGIGNYYFLNEDQYVGSVFWWIGNSFDIIDGCYARYKNMCSEFGDYLDHGKDIIMLFSGIIIILTKYNISFWNYLIFTIIFILHLIHLACDQKASGKKDKSIILNHLQVLLPNSDVSLYVRYFGSSLSLTYVLLLVLLLSPKV
jgi:phosphatidylglycerophosphate synthase